MRFLKHLATPTLPIENMAIENYLYETKITLAENLPQIYTNTKNLTIQQQQSLRKLCQIRNITIKPADKNLGIVILDTEDYIDQIISHLSSDTYNMMNHFPTTTIKTSLENTIIAFKTKIFGHNKNLYNFLQPKQNNRIPRFYGIPKIHKKLSTMGIPPLRPIISHVGSLLRNSTQLIDHVLQPIARAYPDYQHNSISLVNKLSDFNVPNNTLLVSMDIIIDIIHGTGLETSSFTYNYHGRSVFAGKICHQIAANKSSGRIGARVLKWRLFRAL